MADSWFFPALIVLLYAEERGAAEYPGRNVFAGGMGPPKLLLANGFGALTFAVSLACSPLSEVVSGADSGIEGCFYFALLLLLLLGLAQLFLYVAVAVGIASRPRFQGLATPLATATGLFLLAAVIILANCVF